MIYFVNFVFINHQNITFNLKSFQSFHKVFSATINIRMPRSVLISFLLLCTLLTVNGGDSINSKIHMGYGLEFTKKGTFFPSVSAYDVYAKILLVHIQPDWKTVTALALKNKCQSICILGPEMERVYLFLWPMYVKYHHMIHQKTERALCRIDTEFAADTSGFQTTGRTTTCTTFNTSYWKLTSCNAACSHATAKDSFGRIRHSV